MPVNQIDMQSVYPERHRAVQKFQEIPMNKLIIIALASVFAANVALAATPAATPAAAPAAAPAKETVKKDAPAAAPAAPTAAAPAAASDNCEAKAVSKDGKPLAGAAKAASIKKCEKESGAATTKSAKIAQQEKMKACNKEATGKKGDERKKFMSECLKK